MHAYGFFRVNIRMDGRYYLGAEIDLGEPMHGHEIKATKKKTAVRKDVF